MAKSKGGGTKKVCLPLAKIRSMSKSERQSVIRAKRSAGAAGKYKRSSKSNVTGTSSGGDLKTWVKQDWRQVGNPDLKCGEKSPAEMRKTTKGKGRTFRTKEEGAGMTSKGVKQYRKENPGSKLKTAVTGDVKPGSKAAKRRKSFCARSKGWTGERGKAARRRWKC
jgi:hypothetical protein|tara:strand:+ start:513 stop:1010 length:498 start_codon:yes stop_codon:yes gene_type:complete